MQYRRDIDGLRAISVLCIVLYHAGFEVLSGGFVGVDVFFVISGFLITNIICSEVRAGGFSLAGFYERRIRRIFPALLTVVIGALLMALLTLSPEDLITFAHSVAATGAFASNFFFWSRTGYFDAPAENHFLLHTWSLAIEEQFYIFFPLLLAFPLRRAAMNASATIGALAVVSLALDVWLVPRDPTAAFYLMPCRAFELLLGSLAAMVSAGFMRVGWLREAAAVCGLALIIGAVLFFSAATPFPGAAALVPAVGSALVLLAGKSGGSIIATLLSMGVPVFIGKISYSLYLWHWPIFVFARLFASRPLETWEHWGLIGITFVVAYLSWRYIERPFRRPGGVLERPGLFRAAASSVACCLALAIGIKTARGLPMREPPGFREEQVAGQEHYRVNKCLLRRENDVGDWQGEACLINSVSNPVALLWGDSYAAHYVPGFQLGLPGLPFNILQYTATGCPPVRGFSPTKRPGCAEFNNRVDEVIRRYRVSVVILSGQWRAAMRGGMTLAQFSETVRWLQTLGVKVAVIGQSPVFASRVPRRAAWDARRGISGRRSAQLVPAEFNASLRSAAQGALFLDPTPALCSGELCQYGNESSLYFIDVGHLSREGSKLVAKSIAEQLTDLVRHEPKSRQ